MPTTGILNFENEESEAGNNWKFIAHLANQSRKGNSNCSVQELKLVSGENVEGDPTSGLLTSTAFDLNASVKFSLMS